MYSSLGLALLTGKRNGRKPWRADEPCRIVSCATPKGGEYSCPWKPRQSSRLRTSDWAPSALISTPISWCWRNWIASATSKAENTFPCVTYGKSEEQAKALVGEVVKVVIAAAIRLSKPIILE